ncbi:MAG: NifB/NifX family molybdenum-iron cluster-binding protein, partial [Desulfohalobiaceae bacterium]
PQGIPLRELTEIYLPLEGLEAIRLCDLEGLTQEEASKRMDVSRHTLGRILAEARRVLAETVVQGMALRIEGGDYVISGKHQIRDSFPHAETIKQELDMTKIAVTSEGPTLDDRVDPRFGRAAGFVVVDLETMESEYIDNGSSQTMAQGAGIQAAENVVRAGAGALLTGYVGPKAFAALSAAGIKVGQDLEGLTVREAIERYKKGDVSVAEGPNRQGHW